MTDTERKAMRELVEGLRQQLNIAVSLASGFCPKCAGTDLHSALKGAKSSRFMLRLRLHHRL